MNDKFFELTEDKQNRIINAGFHMFSQYGFKKASTDEIAKEAMISKALLFHYFGNKKSFYMYLLSYSGDYLMEKIDMEKALKETDFFKLVLDANKKKINILKNYPYMNDFLIKAYYSEEEDIKEETSGYIDNLVNEVQTSIGKNIDYSKFKDGVDFSLLYKVMYWASESFIKHKIDSNDIDPDKIYEEFAQIVNLFRNNFYREECL